MYPILYHIHRSGISEFISVEISVSADQVCDLLFSVRTKFMSLCQLNQHAPARPMSQPLPTLPFYYVASLYVIFRLCYYRARPVILSVNEFNMTNCSGFLKVDEKDRLGKLFEF